MDAIGRELNAVSENEYNKLMRENVHDDTSAPLEAPRKKSSNHIIPLFGGKRRLTNAEKWSPEGTGHEILLQGFNWESFQSGKYYDTMAHEAEQIAKAGFTVVWLPPPTQSVSPQGYMPGDLYDLNSHYGSEQQLIKAIKAFKSAGVKVLGDAVLNHRCAEHQEDGVWNRYGGKLAWDRRAIVSDHYEYRGTGNKSSGDTFYAAPNIDHSQDFVKEDLKEWLVWLRSHAGFDGWRLDFVKGFHGGHVRDYMEASCPYFAVGEYWDTMNYEHDGVPSYCQDSHRQRTINWIHAAGDLSTAFDITTKGILHATFECQQYWRLRDPSGKPPGLMGWWPSKAVTFLENHDTGSTQGHWPFPHGHLEQGYCYILTHPGSPCVFKDHMDNPHLSSVVQRLIGLRKKASIHCRSKVVIKKAEADVYAAEIHASEEGGPTLVMKIGPGDYCPDMTEWSVADCGDRWAVWERRTSTKK